MNSYLHEEEGETDSWSRTCENGENLSFLQRVVNSNSASLSGTALLALSDDTASICLVRECRELEEVFGTHFTQEILSDNAPSLKEVKDAIHERDRTKPTAKCSEKAPMIAAVARRITWSTLQYAMVMPPPLLLRRW